MYITCFTSWYSKSSDRSACKCYASAFANQSCLCTSFSRYKVANCKQGMANSCCTQSGHPGADADSSTVAKINRQHQSLLHCACAGRFQVQNIVRRHNVALDSMGTGHSGGEKTGTTHGSVLKGSACASCFFRQQAALARLSFQSKLLLGATHTFTYLDRVCERVSQAMQQLACGMLADWSVIGMSGPSGCHNLRYHSVL